MRVLMMIFYLKGIVEFAQKMVESEKHIDYLLLYLLMKLTLVLHVIASIKRIFFDNENQ